jgi:hypothetical protein
MPTEVKSDGGAAFPASDVREGFFQPGMSLRDWFAGQALGALIATSHLGLEDTVPRAYKYADAMIEERKK